MYNAEQLHKKNSSNLKKEKKILFYNKIIDRFLMVFFIFAIFLIMIINILAKDKSFSEIENRTLTTMPKFTISSFMNGDFSEDFSSYINDNFAGRNGFLSIKTSFEKLLGKTKINSVYLGKKNYLIQSFTEASEEETSAKINAINSFFNKHSNLNTNIMLVPTATKVLEEYLPPFSVNDDELAFIDKVFSELNESIIKINPYNALYENKDNYVYYKTDHHWTSNGAYIAYTEFCKALGLTAKSKDEFDIVNVTDKFYGSLSSKIGVLGNTSDSIELYVPKYSPMVVNYISEQFKSSTLFKSEALNTKDKYEVFTGGNHPLINIKSTGDPSKKLLLIKDSYANCFLPFLTSHYGEIFVVDLRYYYDNINTLIENNSITDLLFLFNANTFNSDDSILNIQ